MAFLKPIGLVFASVVLVGNAQCTINGADHDYNSYTCHIMQFLNGVTNLPTGAGFGGSDDMCDGSWAPLLTPVIVNCSGTGANTIKIDLINKHPRLTGCPDWSIGFPEELDDISFNSNDLNCSNSVDLTHISTHLSGLNMNYNDMTGSIVWPSEPTTIDYVDITGNYFDGHVDLSMMNTESIEIYSNLFTSIDFNSIPDGVKNLRANNNQFTGIVDLSNLPDSMNYLFLFTNNFDSPIDFSTMPDSLILYLDTTVQCDASIHCNTNEISADRNSFFCTGQDTCAATCVCIPAPITCPQCQKNCKEEYELCWKKNKAARDVCRAILETCANSCDAIQCVK